MIKSQKIREYSLPTIESHGSVTVDVIDGSIVLFQFDSFKGESRSNYISLTRDESEKLRQILNEELN